MPEAATPAGACAKRLKLARLVNICNTAPVCADRPNAQRRCATGRGATRSASAGRGTWRSTSTTDATSAMPRLAASAFKKSVTSGDCVMLKSTPRIMRSAPAWSTCSALCDLIFCSAKSTWL